MIIGGMTRTSHFAAQNKAEPRREGGGRENRCTQGVTRTQGVTQGVTQVCVVLHCIVLYSLVFYCILFYCIVLYCFVLYCIVLCCIVLYCTVLYSIATKKSSNASTMELVAERCTNIFARGLPRLRTARGPCTELYVINSCTILYCIDLFLLYCIALLLLYCVIVSKKIICALTPDELTPDEKKLHQILVNPFFSAYFFGDGFVRDTFSKHGRIKIQ